MKRPRLVAVVSGAGIAVALTIVAVVGINSAAAGSGTASPATASATPTSNPLFAGGLQDPARGAAMTARADATPTRVRIPAIGVDSGLEALGVDASGQLSPPVDYDSAGWFTDGVVPGQIGPAIIAGHIDSATGPAVFAGIASLAVGDQVLVDLSTGQTLTFVITGSEQSPKAAFPTSDVYSNVPRPELRLITCAGAFDRSIGHYTDNLILFAALQQ